MVIDNLPDDYQIDPAYLTSINNCSQMPQP